jgi:hypothetical protein
MKRYLLAILFVLSTVVTVSAQESKVFYPWQETRKGLDVKFFGAYSYGLGVNTGYNMMQAEISSEIANTLYKPFYDAFKKGVNYGR